MALPVPPTCGTSCPAWARGKCSPPVAAEIAGRSMAEAGSTLCSAAIAVHEGRHHMERCSFPADRSRLQVNGLGRLGDQFCDIQIRGTPLEAQRRDIPFASRTLGHWLKRLVLAQASGQNARSIQRSLDGKGKGKRVLARRSRQGAKQPGTVAGPGSPGLCARAGRFRRHGGNPPRSMTPAGQDGVTIFLGFEDRIGSRPEACFDISRQLRILRPRDRSPPGCRTGHADNVRARTVGAGSWRSMVA